MMYALLVPGQMSSSQADSSSAVTPRSGAGGGPADAERGVRGGEARDRDPVGRARHVVEADLVTELHRRGVATVLAAHNSVQVSLGGLTPGSTFVLATIQANIAKLYIRGVVVSSSSSFTIYLSHAPTKTVQVAWFVLN